MPSLAADELSERPVARSQLSEQLRAKPLARLLHRVAARRLVRPVELDAGRMRQRQLDVVRLTAVN